MNFAPADFRKCGTSFDIGVAAAILLAMDFVPETYIKDTLFVGELSLNGQICPISGVYRLSLLHLKRNKEMYCGTGERGRGCFCRADGGSWM